MTLSIPEPTTHVVELRAHGRSFYGWKSVSVQAGVEQAARTFSLECIDVNLPSDEPPSSPVLLRPTDACEIWCRGHKVSTGYIDAISVHSSPTETGINVSGRSKTQDVVDCSVALDKRKWKEKPLDVIANDIAEPFGVEVVAEVDLGGTIPRFKVRRGERAFDALQRLCQPRGLLITDDADGRLVLTRAGATKASTAIEQGANVLESDFTFDASQLYTVYWCRSQLAVPRDNPAQLVALQKTFVQDDTMTRHRPLEVMPTGRVSPKRAEDLVRYEAAVRAGKAVSGDVSVSGWTQSPDGPLWTHNQIAQYTSLVQGIFAELLVVSTDYQIDPESGEVVRMALAPPSGYELLTEPERRRVPRKKKKPAIDGVGAWKELADVVARSSAGIPAKRPDDRKWWDKGKAAVRREPK